MSGMTNPALSPNELNVHRAQVFQRERTWLFNCGEVETLMSVVLYVNGVMAV